MPKQHPLRSRNMRDTTLPHVDKSAPGYLVIYGVFGGLTPFARAMGIHKTTAQWWVVNGLIPAHRQAEILGVAAKHKLKLDPAMFVPAAQPQIVRDLQIRDRQSADVA